MAIHRSSLASTVFKNTIFVTFGSLALKVVNFAFSIYVVRRLGDDRFGQYAVVLAFVGLFQILGELGISQYAMREIAQDKSKTSGLFWNLLAVRFLLGLLCLAIIPLAARLFGYQGDLLLGVLLYTSSFLLAAIEAPMITVLTANERFDYATAMTIVGQIGFTIFGAVFLFSGYGFIWLIVASLASFAPKIALGLWAIRKHRLLPFQPQFSPRSWPALIRAGMPFGIITLTLTIAFSIDAVMLKAFTRDEVVGWYRVAYDLIFSILFITRGFKEAMVPSLSRAYVSDPTQVQRWYYRTVKVISMLSLPIAIGGMMTAHALVQFLLTPEYYPPSAIALQILIWDVPFLMFAAFCGNMATVLGLERKAARIYTINAIANVVLNAIFIPLYGYIAASVITVVTDLIGALQFHLLLSARLQLPTMSRVLLRVAAAASLMGLALWLGRGLHVALLIPMGVAAYLILALVFRLPDAEELGLARRLLKKVGLLKTVS